MSDMDGYVTGLQGRAVSNTAPSDGYVLTWSDGYSEWQPKPVASSGGLRKDYFTSDGYWTCPEGVTNIIVIACGGGGGGMGGKLEEAGPGGGGALQQTGYVSVTPGLNYDIIIGSGGTGYGGFAPSSPVTIGNVGGTSSFKYSGASLFSTIGGGRSSKTQYGGGSNFGEGGPVDPYPMAMPGCGGFGRYNAPGQKGFKNCINVDLYDGGTGGSGTVSVGGGGGGGAGPQGNGGNGGNGSLSGVGGNASNAPTNSGAGGGGGGGVADGISTGGAGGNGGSGYLYIIY